jgi:threonine synthase
MRYVSTRGGGEPLTFKQTILTGLARDGGLYLPAEIPDVRDRLAGWRTLNYQDLAFEIIRLFADDIPDDVLRDIVVRSYATFRHSEVTPVVEVGPVHRLNCFTDRRSPSRMWRCNSSATCSSMSWGRPVER